MLCKIKVQEYKTSFVLLIICTSYVIYANKHNMLCTVKVQENKTSSYCFSYVLFFLVEETHMYFHVIFEWIWYGYLALLPHAACSQVCNIVHIKLIMLPVYVLKTVLSNVIVTNCFITFLRIDIVANFLLVLIWANY